MRHGSLAACSLSLPEETTFSALPPREELGTSTGGEKERERERKAAKVGKQADRQVRAWSDARANERASG